MTRPKPTSPASGTHGVRPRLGFRPTSPQHEAGTRSDPPPSLPWANGIAPAATSAADPPLDPPTPRSGDHGLAVGPCLTDSVEKLSPNSGAVLCPRATRPAARKRAIRSWSTHRDRPADRPAAQRERHATGERPAVLDDEGYAGVPRARDRAPRPLHAGPGAESSVRARHPSRARAAAGAVLGRGLRWTAPVLGGDRRPLRGPLGHARHACPPGCRGGSRRAVR